MDQREGKSTQGPYEPESIVTYGGGHQGGATGSQRVNYIKKPAVSQGGSTEPRWRHIGK